MKNTWKKATTGLLAMALVVSGLHANVRTGGLFSKSVITANAEVTWIKEESTDGAWYGYDDSDGSLPDTMALVTGKTYRQTASKYDEATETTIDYTRFVFVRSMSELKGKSEVYFTATYGEVTKTFETSTFYTGMTANGIQCTPDSEDSVLLVVTITGVSADEVDENKLTCEMELVESKKDAAETTVNLSELTNDYETKDGDVLTGTLAGNYKITIADGATVTLKDAVINGAHSSDTKWAGITPNGDATIILDGNNTVKGFHAYYPGIYIPEDKTLTIKGDGTLEASSNGWAPGIGGGYMLNCGNIVIEGGNITSIGASQCAGIGSGDGGSGIETTCGDITISGGIVNAKGGKSGAGIGSGFKASCGNITIKNTVTSVTATKGNFANSIGAGDSGTCGTITIEDNANVTQN